MAYAVKLQAKRLHLGHGFIDRCQGLRFAEGMDVIATVIAPEGDIMPVPSTKIRLATAIANGGGFTLLPSSAGDQLATPLGEVGPRSLAVAGDLNGDGFADLIVGMPGSNDKAVDAGRVFVTMGVAVAGSSQDVSHGTPDALTIDGVHAGDMAGFAVAGISDLNGDGLGEILVGAPGMAVGAASDAGAGFVVWGKSAGGSGTGVDLSDPFSQSGGGYAIKGQAAGDLAGYSMTSVGDMNGDGLADVLIGAPGQDANGADAGAAYVVWGKASDTAVLLNNVATGAGGFRIAGAAAGDGIGKVIAALGDQDGDGRSEIMLGSAAAHGGAGAVYVVNGKATGAAVDLAALTGGYEISGQAGDGAGSSLADAGDVNGDGRHDLLIGAAASNAAYLVYGQPGTGAVNLADVAAGVGGIKITAAPGSDLSGMVVLGGVDLNHDGISDLVIGTPHDAEGGADAGAVYVVWGDQLYRPINLSEVASGIGGAKIVGSLGSLAGSMVSFAGDANGDGTTDLMIGAPGRGASVKVLYTPATWGPDNNIYGSAGADVIGAGYGGTYHRVGDGADVILGLDGADTIDGAGGNDTIEGGVGNDSLLGGADNDLLDGGSSIDVLTGGSGDDTYVVDRGADQVVELALEGTDTVRAAVNYTLGADVENLVLTGSATFGTGNASANVITGNVLDNTLDGKAGIDTLIGGAGNDTYVVADAGDMIVEAGTGGVDTVRAGINWTLGANLETLVLTGTALRGTGNALANLLVGTAGNNSLDGGAGIDTLQGGAGDDTYVVGDAADQVIEDAGGGNDTVRAAVDYTLGAEVETLILTGGARHGTGNILNNAIVGTAFGDVLDGGAGADRLSGGRGDDIYVFDNLGDIAVETKTGGIDTVRAAIDWTLGANLENLELTGAARTGIGNALANHLTGTLFADVLDGGAGADTMTGGSGDDVYRVDNAGDVVVELAGGGKDTVLASLSIALTDGVENLTLTRAGLTGTGNLGNNVLTGSAGGDSLVGLDGNDTLDGAGGADTLVGGAGDDTYVLDSVGDLIIEGAGGGRDTVVLMRDGLTVSGDIEVIRLGGSAHIAIGDASDNILEGGSGGDSLDGGAGNDLLLAGDGNDVLTATSGHDNLSGGSGNDVYHIHGAAVDIEDFLGHDTIDASDGTADQHIDLSGETESEIENEVCHITPGGTTAGPLDVQFLQDLTGSFADDIATVRGLIPQIVTAVAAVQADATFGVSSFVDKPVSPFGAAGEWVYRQEQALSADSATLSATYARIANLNGLDGPEAQLEALMQLALHAADVGYRADSARFVVVFTDAPFHIAGDGAAGGILTPNNGDGLTPGNGAFEDYPLIAQVQAALIAANIIPIFAIAGGYESTYQGLVDTLGRGTVVTLTANSSNIVAAIAAGMTAATTTHIEDANAGSGNDTVIGGGEDNVLCGNAGNDNLDGRAGDDRLHGGLGDDVMTGGAGTDTLIGGAGNDRIVLSGAFADYAITVTADGVQITDLRAGSPDGIDLATGVENFGFSDGDRAGSALWGVVVTDTLTAGNDVLAVVDTDHHVISGLAGADSLTGGDGFDTLLGGAGNDTLAGGRSDDVINGGTGADVLSGGGGSDVFVFSAAIDSARATPDVIIDFATGLDVIDLSAIDADAGVAGDQAFVFVGAAGFTHVAGELRLAPAGAGFLQLSGDVNGDGIADFALKFDLTTGVAPVLSDMFL